MAQRGGTVAEVVNSRAELGATDRLVDWVVNASAADIPKETQDFAAALLLKTVTTMALGACEPFGESLIRRIAQAGGTPQASVAGAGLRTSMATAAFANGTLGHAPEMEDCFFRPENRETSSPIWIFPGLLAVAEARGATGRDLLTASVVAFEVCSRLVRGAPGLGVVHGINTCTWWGVPATAAGAARLLGLNHEQTRNAMSIALSQSCGLGYQTGYDAHKLEAGHSCRAGVEAALLAADGATGAPGFVENLNLAFAVVQPDGTADPAGVVADLGGLPFSVHHVEFKKYPGCGLVHASVDSLSDLLKDEGLSGGDVASVETRVSRHTAAYCDRPNPESLDAARWSFSWLLAEILLEGRVRRSAFTDASRLDSPVHREARSRVRVVVDDSLSTGFSGARLTVRTVGGREIQRDTETFLGHPDDPVAPSQAAAILEPFLVDVMPQAAASRIVELVMSVAELDDVGELMQLLADFRSTGGN